MAKRVLIVEDENIIALELAWQMESLGYQVAGIIPRGEDAVERAAELKPDLLLMDISLKGELDGYQTAEIIQAKYSVPVIYLSAFFDDKTLKEAASNGKKWIYLKKPFSEYELKKAIDHCFDGKTKENLQNNGASACA